MELPSQTVSLRYGDEGRILVSRSIEEVRFWRSDTWECVAQLRNPNESIRDSGLAFHPSLPLLALVGSLPATPKSQQGRDIYILELDLQFLRSNTVSRTAKYTSAKVVLVGESNVGKSYLAHRIATGEAPHDNTIKSTHGMKFWPIEPEKLSPAAAAQPGDRRDIVLWDMGGQDEYRLVHQLFLHDTTLALVLMDPTRGRSAFAEVETWNTCLEKQLRGRSAIKLLVGSKVDRPSETIDRQAIERLKQECGFLTYWETSAVTGRGVSDL